MKKMYIESNNAYNCIMVNEDGKWYTTNCSDTNGFFGDVQIQTEESISEIAKKLHKQLEVGGGIDIEGMREIPEIEEMSIEEMSIEEIEFDFINTYNNGIDNYILVGEID